MTTFVPVTGRRDLHDDASRVSTAALVEAIQAETRLLGDLIGVIRRQRDGVARDDAAQVDDSVFATHRILRTISEARRRRRQLVTALTGAQDLALDDLDDALGPLMSEELARARDTLRETALALSREVAVNRRVLQEALRSGEEYMRAMYGAQPTQVRYDAGARSVDAPRRSVIINRQV